MSDCCLTTTSQHARLSVYSATSLKQQSRGRHVTPLKQQSRGRHVTPLKHIILTLSQTMCWKTGHCGHKTFECEFPLIKTQYILDTVL
jgi:hypothetical protein